MTGREERQDSSSLIHLNLQIQGRAPFDCVRAVLFELRPAYNLWTRVLPGVRSTHCHILESRSWPTDGTDPRRVLAFRHGPALPGIQDRADEPAADAPLCRHRARRHGPHALHRDRRQGPHGAPGRPAHRVHPLRPRPLLAPGPPGRLRNRRLSPSQFRR